MVDDQRGAAPRSPRTAEYWLSEEQALFVTTQSGTTRARAITLQLVRAFIAARHALNKPILDKDLVSPLEDTLAPLYGKYEQIEKRLDGIENNSGFGVRPMLLVPLGRSRGCRLLTRTPPILISAVNPLSSSRASARSS